MLLVTDPKALGQLLRAKRTKRKRGWKRMHEVVGVEIKTMQLWERGVTKDPPLRKALLFAEEVGVPLDELAAAALGRPYREPAPTNGASAGSGVAGAVDLGLDPAAQPERKQPQRSPGSRRSGQPSPDE